MRPRLSVAPVSPLLAPMTKLSFLPLLCFAVAVTAAPDIAAQEQPAPAWSAALDSLVRTELARTGTPGAQVAVALDGRVVYSKGYGVADIETGRAVTERTLFRVGSVTKMVTAAALAEMAAQGTVDLQAPVGRYVPELAGRRVADVTTHQLLTHSAGWLDNATAYGRMGEAALGEVFRDIGDTLFFTTPGRVISYSNPGYSMAGYVAEVAGKARFADVVDRLVTGKLGMERATFRPLEALTHDFSQGHIVTGTNPPAIVRPFTENTAQWAAGFLFASAGEFARFTIALMDRGRLDGAPVLSPEAVTMMTTGHIAIPGGDDHYGYGLRVGMRGGQRVWQHGGSINGFDAEVTMFPDRRLAVLVFDNRGGESMPGIIDFVARHAGGIDRPAAAAAPTELRPDAAARALIAGRFAHGPMRVEIALSGDSLVFKQGNGTAPIRILSDDRAVITVPNGTTQTVLLVRGTDGRVEYLHRGLRALARQ